MKKVLSTLVIILTVFSALFVNSTAIAQTSTPNGVATVSIQSSTITWTPIPTNIKGMTLTIIGAGNFYFQKQYRGSASVSVSSGSFNDGTYNYELVLAPSASSDSKASPELRGLGSQASSEMKLAGVFTVLNKAFVTAASESNSQADVVQADDLIVQGSICAGFDCVDNESFGFDTLRLKENNTRIGFNDTSVGAFPSNDWTIVANDSASGGANFLGFEDVTGAKFPFKVMAGAPTNSLFVSSNGDIGVRTSTPVLDVHLNTTDTPGVRLEQTNAGGFTAQTWDIAGNEANFFVRDVTGGSKLPFRIRPGAPTSSIDIAASGNVGVGTASPTTDLDVFNSAADTILSVRRSDGATLNLKADATSGHIATGNSFPLSFDVNNLNAMTIATSGNVGIGTTSPTAKFDVANSGAAAIALVRRTDVGGSTLRFASGLNLSTVGTTTNSPLGLVVNGVQKVTLATDGSLTVDGPVNATVFNPTSDKNAKENFAPINQKTVLERLSALPISTWNFIENDNKTKHMGPMAQDFYAAFGLGADDKHISTVDADGVAFAAIQELNKQNTSLSSENAALRSKVDDLTARVAALESGSTANTSTPNWMIILLVAMNLGLAALFILSRRSTSVVKVENK